MWLQVQESELSALRRLATGHSSTGDEATLRELLLRHEKNAPTTGELDLIAQFANTVEEDGLVELDPANAISRAEGGMWVMGWFYLPCDSPASQAQCLAPDCSRHESPTANWRGYCEECSLGLGYGAVRLAFEPQKWQRNYALPADPRGPIEWEVPRSIFLERFPDQEAFEKDSGTRDGLRHYGTVPAWISEWSGPFEVRLADDQPSPWDNLK